LSSFGPFLFKIQNKFVNYCEFRSTCPYSDPDQFTCINKGGSHCGKYRHFKREKTMDEPAQSNEIA
jgi:hypothetical protein